jgi:hypothetical protein
MSAPSEAPARRSRGLSARAKVGLGVLLTLVGLFVLGGTVPTAPGTLERDVAVTGLAALGLWLGGVLLGSARR